jgi:hypothetical protein
MTFGTLINAPLGLAKLSGDFFLTGLSRFFLSGGFSGFFLTSSCFFGFSGFSSFFSFLGLGLRFLMGSIFFLGDGFAAHDIIGNDFVYLGGKY